MNNREIVVAILAIPLIIIVGGFYFRLKNLVRFNERRCKTIKNTSIKC
jgi:uncharacterized protein YxeA